MGLSVTMSVESAPDWAAFLATLILPALWFYQYRIRVAVTGRCLACGYDLRATPDRCPECGIVVTKASAQQNIR
jgi:hypothetical protein